MAKMSKTDLVSDVAVGNDAAGHSTRSEWVYERLLREIKLGHFGPGERLREAEVARTLGVSRTPVREALSRLHYRGLVELTPSGLMVSRLNRAQTIELFSMREVLEGTAAMFAAQYASPSEIEDLRQILDAFGQNLGNAARLAEINHLFHNAIYEAAHNRYLLRTLDELNDSLALLPSTTFTLPDRGQKSLDEHQAILDAIAGRQPQAAQEAISSHIRNAQMARLSMMLERS
jgi:DNA-binding GntR family transcriptional regulator